MADKRTSTLKILDFLQTRVPSESAPTPDRPSKPKTVSETDTPNLLDDKLLKRKKELKSLNDLAPKEGIPTIGTLKKTRVRDLLS